MATEHTRRWSGPLRGPFATLRRLGRLGDIPVVMMLAWAGWLAVPWSFSGLAQARAAAANASPPQVRLPDSGVHQDPPTDHGRPAAGAAGPAARSGSVPPATHTGALGPAAHPDSVSSPAHAGSVQRGASAEFVRQGASAQAAWGMPATAQAGQRLRTMLPARALPPTGDSAPAAFADSTPSTFAGSTRDSAPAAFADSAAAAFADSAPAAFAGSAPAAFAGSAPVDGAGAWPDVMVSERARIAGEVHDAAGHGLAAIAMQAGLALVTLDDDPEQARASLQAIRDTSTLALAQLRAALDGIDPPGGDLAGLIGGVRAAGLPVDVEPADLTVPTPLRDTVYRVVRESLTNVLRHAGPTRALVRVSGDARELVLEVADRGTGWTGSAEGRGLAGMRARVTETGGRFTAGPREGGGFQVVARFPQVSA
ncbi:sensor histidine kinase [Nonomuraea jiangxiensis]|uniref:histidine kinase n=1 Tax=Nonomuraea jiangxiensis TaxID=633440 RepID=A0A1G8RMG7_9ACTN|nr:histidine kinase [Nonomuraea jiangxiensis]SDJ18129.1 Histidine kinase [Nonomuraea jiangxiensis]